MSITEKKGWIFWQECHPSKCCFQQCASWTHACWFH